jgi:hypothetical protein
MSAARVATTPTGARGSPASSGPRDQQHRRACTRSLQAQRTGVRPIHGELGCRLAEALARRWPGALRADRYIARVREERATEFEPFASLSGKIELRGPDILMTLHAEDMYNFNPGAADIATGTPDSDSARGSTARERGRSGAGLNEARSSMRCAARDTSSPSSHSARSRPSVPELRARRHRASSPASCTARPRPPLLTACELG